jgi:predicted nucleic acid-binding protein
MKVFADCNMVIDPTDNLPSFSACMAQLDRPESMSSGMSILESARQFGPNSGVVLYTNAHVEFNVRKALSTTRRDRFGAVTRPAWSESDIDAYCGFYKSAVARTGGSTSEDLAKDDPRIAQAEGRNAPDHEDAVMYASAKASPATVLCTADKEFRNMQTLDLQWPEDSSDILELWSLEDVKEEVFCAVQAYLKNRMVAA